MGVEGVGAEEEEGVEAWVGPVGVWLFFVRLHLSHHV